MSCRFLLLSGSREFSFLQNTAYFLQGPNLLSVDKTQASQLQQHRRVYLQDDPEEF